MSSTQERPSSGNSGESVDNLVDAMIGNAYRSRASDIHVERNRSGVRVRYRIDGVLSEPDATIVTEPNYDAVTSRLRILAGMDANEKRVIQDGRIRTTVDGKPLDLRVCAMPAVTGECLVMRLIDRSVGLAPLEAQGLLEDEQKTLTNWCNRANGLIIVTGPTGCGKTTTLYSMLTRLNEPTRKIVTVEDPVEFLIDGINQMQVNSRIGITFASAIRSELRQAPNIIMVGEIRDLETAELCVKAAVSGHLVFTTLHTVDTAGALRRLLDIGIEPFLANSAIVGVMAQRLVRKVCPDCKEAYDPESWVRDTLGDSVGPEFFRGKGCAKCARTGYRGRTAIHELLEINDRLRVAMANDAGIERLRQCAIDSGMTTLRQDGLNKAAQGITTVEEVLRVVGD